MNDDRFDALTRRLGTAPRDRASRRDVLQWLGLGGAVAGMDAVATSGAGGTAAAAQATPDAATPTAPDAATQGFHPSGGPTLEQLAWDLQFDLAALFHFVRDEVAYEAYAGALRGANGTLWGLAGNSVDQAGLLAALLKAAAVPTRFVVGELSAEAGDRLLASLRLDEATVRARAERLFVPATSEGDAEAELTAEGEELLTHLTKAQERLQEIVERQVGDGIQTVLDALAGAGITLPQPEVKLPDLELSQHVWLQYADGPEWIDLDPSLPDAEPGDVFAKAAATHDQLPEELAHRISLRLVAEKLVGGVPTREELLSFAATSGELVGVPITLMHPDAESLKAAGVAIESAIGGYRNFMPSLVVGEQSIAGQPVTFLTGEGVLDVFGEGPTDGETLGEWLEIDLRTPDGERHVVREIFDRVGFARRGDASVDLTTIPPVELEDVGGDAPGYRPLADVWSIGVVSGAVPWGYFVGEEQDDQDPLLALSRAAHVYHGARDALALENTSLRGQRFYLDEPNLTAVVQSPTAGTTDGQTHTMLMDLLYRHLVAIPVDGVDTQAQPPVAAGVFGHAVERALIETTGEELLGLAAEDFLSVGRVFEEAKRQGIPTLVLRPGADDASRLAVGETARLRIEAALAEGYVVILPERAVTFGEEGRTGWWLLDPDTGATSDQLDDGRGATLPEWARITLTMACFGVGFFTLGMYSSIIAMLAGTETGFAAVGRFVDRWARTSLVCFGGVAPAAEEDE